MNRSHTWTTREEGCGQSATRGSLVVAAVGLAITATACVDADVGGEILPADDICAQTRTDEVDRFYSINDIYVDDRTIAWDTALPEEVGLDAVEPFL